MACGRGCRVGRRGRVLERGAESGRSLKRGKEKGGGVDWTSKEAPVAWELGMRGGGRVGWMADGVGNEGMGCYGRAVEYCGKCGGGGGREWGGMGVECVDNRGSEGGREAGEVPGGWNRLRGAGVVSGRIGWQEREIVVESDILGRVSKGVGGQTGGEAGEGGAFHDPLFIMDDPSKLEPSSPPFAEIGPKDDNINTTSSTVSGGSTSSTPVPENNIPSLPFELPQPPIIPQENNEEENTASRTINKWK
ncbi:hypothetical protein Tco_0278161 [Tanacetum coccineum]